jgi:hypothetical protein
LSNISRLQPIVNRLFNLRGHWYRPNMTGFAYQINDDPMILAMVKMLDSELN